MPPIASNNFIDREVFSELIARVPREDGTAYQDIATIYGDMSRIVVMWLATTPPEELRAMYNRLGWLGNANARAMHEAAQKWVIERGDEKRMRMLHGGNGTA